MIRIEDVCSKFNAALLCSLYSLIAGCGAGDITKVDGDSDSTGDGDGDGDGDSEAETTTGDGDGDGDDEHGTTNGCPFCFDFPPDGPECDPDVPGCKQVDVLLVIDNSGTMGEEQVNLANNFPLLIDQLLALTDAEGEPLDLDVNLMVTTTDLGHPGCTPFQPDGYEPKQGAPQDVACIDRLDDFNGLGANAPSFPEACTIGCPLAIVPADPFIHFEGPGGAITNIPGNNIEGALGCIGPQGINGCGYESPLEAMLQALNPDAEWNQGPKPFLREKGLLAVVIVTDEADCSVQSPDGYAYFTDEAKNDYWEINPETGTKTQATSAVCWNAGVDCGMPDANGVYADCTSIETGVLFPMDRYSFLLQDQLLSSHEKQVVMLGIVGVPPSGVEDLVYRQWRDGAYPTGDILPDEDKDAAALEFTFGIGPGCTGEDGMGNFTGQAIPPVRIKELCQSLDMNVGGPEESIRCCLESVCDDDFSGAFACLTGLIQNVVED